MLAPPAFRSLLSRALREVSLPALTTCVPLALFAGTPKKRSFLIEILLGKWLDHEGRRGADKFRHSGNDGFRQGVSYCTRAGMILGLILTDSGSELTGVFIAAASGRIARAATRVRLWTTPLVAHLRGQSANAVFVE